jgi:hypothetical protein
MFTQPVEDAAERCPARPVESEGYSSGVGQNDRTGALCAMPCPTSHIAPFVFCAFASASSEALLKPGAPFALCSLLYAPCTMLYAFCAMLVTPPGLGDSLRRYPIKLHQLTMRVELFYFVCRMKLVLRLDVGRWSRILRVWYNCQKSRFDPR